MWGSCRYIASVRMSNANRVLGVYCNGGNPIGGLSSLFPNVGSLGVLTTFAKTNNTTTTHNTRYGNQQLYIFGAAGLAIAAAGVAKMTLSDDRRGPVKNIMPLRQRGLHVSNAMCESVPSSALNEVVLGKSQDFSEGELYDVKVFGGKSGVLVMKIDGKFHCTGSSCSHYSAPLQKGVLTKSHVTCPWHDAEFDIKTGLCINGPGLNGIPVYEVYEKDGNVVAKLPTDMKESVTPPMCGRDPNDKRVFVIVGGGPTGLTAVETLRQQGYTGRIVWMTDEPNPPVDRPVLSKNLGVPLEKVLLRTKDFIQGKGCEAELMLDTRVKKIDPSEKMVYFGSDKKMKYDKLLLAPGASPRQLQMPGSDLKNIFTIRSVGDAGQISQFAQKGMRVVVVGSSFIGMEVAASLARKNARVTVIGTEAVPFQRVLGDKVGGVFKNLLIEKGVEYVPNATVKSFKGDAGSVRGVELTNGEIMQADAVIIGAGVIPNTKAIEHNLQAHPDGSVVVDALLKTSHDDVFAGGDCARFPYFMDGSEIRVEHWDVAMQHGRIAARNMLNQFVPYRSVPFFSTMMFGKSLRYAGNCSSYDEVICEGNLEKYEFVAYYIKDEKVVAVATMGKDPVAVGVCEAMKLGLIPHASLLKHGVKNSDSILQDLKGATKGTVA